MNRRKFILGITGFLAAIPFIGGLFANKEESTWNWADPKYDKGGAVTAEQFDKLLEKFECKDVYLNGERYRAINIIDDVVVQRIENWSRMRGLPFKVMYESR
jgi:hypothetical protein